MSLFFSTFHHQTSFRLCSRYSSSSFSKSSSGIKRLSSSFFFVNESERKTFPHRRVHFSRTRMSKRDFGDTKTAATSSKRHQSMTGTEDTIGHARRVVPLRRSFGVLLASKHGAVSPTAESFAREMPTRWRNARSFSTSARSTTSQSYASTTTKKGSRRRLTISRPS